MQLTLPSTKGSMLTHAELEANLVGINQAATDALDAATTAATSASNAVTQVNSLAGQLSDKADLGTVAAALDYKANKSETYTKAETATQIDTRIQAIVGTAPANLDTLQEIAEALQSEQSVVGALTTSIAAKADKSTVDTLTTAVNSKVGTDTANTFQQVQTFGKAVVEKAVAVAAVNIDASAGAVFTKTVTAPTAFTVSGAPAAGTVGSFILEVTNGGAFATSYWGGLKWAGGAAPVLTVSGKDILGFYTIDAGVSWNGFVLGKDVK